MIGLRKAAEMALAALEDANTVIEHKQDVRFREQAIEALRQALAQDKRPVKSYCGGIPNYVTDPEPNKFCDAHCTWADHHPDCDLNRQDKSDLANRVIVRGEE